MSRPQLPVPPSVSANRELLSPVAAVKKQKIQIVSCVVVPVMSTCSQIITLTNTTRQNSSLVTIRRNELSAENRLPGFKCHDDMSIILLLSISLRVSGEGAAESRLATSNFRRWRPTCFTRLHMRSNSPSGFPPHPAQSLLSHLAVRRPC